MIKVEKYNNFKPLNERFLTYEDLGMKTPTYKDKVISSVINIVMEENGVSEKSFSQIDNIKDKVKESFINYEIIDKINECEKYENRIKYCAEYIYQWYIRNTDIEKSLKKGN